MADDEEVEDILIDCALIMCALHLSLALDAAIDEQDEYDEMMLRRLDRIAHPFDLSSVRWDHSEVYFRFSREEIVELSYLLGFDRTFTSPARHSLPGRLCFCVFLWSIAQSSHRAAVAQVFSLSQTQAQYAYAAALDHLYALCNPSLSSIDIQYIQGRCPEFASAITAITGIDNVVVLFADGSFFEILRPAAPAHQQRYNDDQYQRFFYNGNHATHGVNFIFITGPDGLIHHLFGPYPGARHDMGLLHDCPADAALRSWAAQRAANGQIVYKVFADKGFADSIYMLATSKNPRGGLLPDAAQQRNVAMSRARISVEWKIADVKKPFTLLKRPVAIGNTSFSKLVFVSSFLSNIRNCLHPSLTSQYFGVRAPSLVEYLARAFRFF